MTKRQPFMEAYFSGLTIVCLLHTGYYLRLSAWHVTANSLFHCLMHSWIDSYFAGIVRSDAARLWCGGCDLGAVAFGFDVL
jgi:hypothetical protein